MKYYRFMSKDEFRKVIDGETLVSRLDHSSYARSNSVGFCFLREDSYVSGEENEYPVFNWRSTDSAPEQARDVIGGVCGSDEMFVEFIDAGVAMAKSRGTYADFSSFDFYARADVEEYCCVKYDNSTLIPVRAWEKNGVDYFEVKFTTIPMSYWESKYGGDAEWK